MIDEKNKDSVKRRGPHSLTPEEMKILIEENSATPPSGKEDGYLANFMGETYVLRKFPIKYYERLN